MKYEVRGDRGRAWRPLGRQLFAETGPPIRVLDHTPFPPKPSVLSGHSLFSAKRSSAPFSLVSASGKLAANPKNWSLIDEHYQTIRQDMFTLFEDLRIAA